MINIDQYRSILIRTRHNSCFETESETLVKKSPDQYWSILIYIDQYWSILINIDQYWSGLGIIVVLKQSLCFGKEKSWSILINIDQYWSILIRTRHYSCFETESETFLKKNPDQYWSILINIDQYRFILIRNRHNSCFETEAETLVKKIPDQYWSILINIDQYWSRFDIIVVLKQSLWIW